MPRTTDEKLDDSINVPIPRKLKARVVSLAKAVDQAPTKFARALITEGVERRERRQPARA